MGTDVPFVPRRLQARRVVAVLAVRAEVVDPEALHAALDRCSDVIEWHGGSVELYLGDGLIGVFGLTETHGDDGLRAARAAVELRAAGLRIGIELGEIFVGPGPRGADTVTGAAITAARRLAEQAAEGTIRLGDAVARSLAADATIDSGVLLELRQAALAPGAIDPIRGPRDGARAAPRDLRGGVRRACVPPRHRRGRRGDRQIALERRVRGARSTTRRCWRAAACPTARARRIRRSPTSCARSTGASKRCSTAMSRPFAPSWEPRSRSRRRRGRCAGCSSGSPSTVHWSWSSRTSTGPNRRCST